MNKHLNYILNALSFPLFLLAWVIPAWFWFFWNSIPTFLDAVFFVPGIMGYPVVDTLIGITLGGLGLVALVRSFYFSRQTQGWYSLIVMNTVALFVWYAIESSGIPAAMLLGGIMLTIAFGLNVVLFGALFVLPADRPLAS